MKFPNAQKAVTKLFVAEIMTLCIVVFSLVAALLSAIALSIENNEGLLIATAAIGLTALIASILVFIFQLIALIQGGKDESHFKVALFMVVIVILINIASVVLQSIDATKDLNVLFSVLEAVSNVANTIVIVAILYAISSLADRLRDRKMSDRGSTLAVMVVLLFIVSIALDLIPYFFQNITPGWQIAFSIFGIVALVIQILLYINIVIYYYKSSKMLKREA